jgi:hypothetical protein
VVARILLVLGPCTLVVGAWRGSAGLAAVGGAWFLLSFACGWHGRRLRAELAEHRAEHRTTTTRPAPAGPPVSMRTFVRGTALVLLAGLPAVAVGGWRLGIDRGDAEWRWLPLVGGGALTAMAVVAALMFLLGAGVLAAAGPPPTIPAEVVIVSMKQTGTYVNNQPRVEFVLDVRPQSGATYRVTKKATVPLLALGSLGVGRGFNALVAGPDEPTDMDIDWDSPLPADPPVS